MPDLPDTVVTSMIMHRLREYRVDQGYSQSYLDDILANHGCTLSRGLYAKAERSPHHLCKVASPAFRIAAARILRLPYAEITQPIDLPNPCNYCHLTPPQEVCLGCDRTYDERL